jgi:hypothetical protein
LRASSGDRGARAGRGRLRTATIGRAAGGAACPVAARGSGDEIRPRDPHGQPRGRAVAADRLGNDLGGVPASAHSSAPARQPPPACAAAPEDPPLPGAESPGADDRGLRNQSDTAESVCAGARGVAAAGAATGVGTTGVGNTGIGFAGVGTVGIGAVAGAGVGTAADQPFAGRLLADCPTVNRPGRPPDQGDGAIPCSVTLSGNQTRTIRPRGDLARSRTRTPCRSASRATANSPMCRDTETPMTGGLSSRRFMSVSRASGTPTPLSLTSISTPPLGISWPDMCTGVSLGEKIVAFSMISASRCTTSEPRAR